jgi:hypothetical protein
VTPELELDLRALARAAVRTPPPPTIASRAAVLVHERTRRVAWIDRAPLSTKLSTTVHELSTGRDIAQLRATKRGADVRFSAKNSVCRALGSIAKPSYAGSNPVLSSPSFARLGSAGMSALARIAPWAMRFAGRIPAMP